MTETNQKSKVVAGLLAIFLGGIGAHRFYLGQPKLALLYIAGLFVGVSIIVGFVEGIRYLALSDSRFKEEVHRGAVSSPQPAPVYQSTHLTQISTEKFALALLGNELKVTRRPYATTVKQIIDTAITNADEGEFTVDLASISGVWLKPATNDKMSMGYFSGRLKFYSSSHTGYRTTLGTRHQGDLEFDFTKSSEPRVKAFVRAFEEELAKVKSTAQEEPMVSSSKPLSDELEKLVELKSAGLLTDDEFEKAKTKLLEA